MSVPYPESILESFQQAFLTRSLSTLAVLESRDGKKGRKKLVAEAAEAAPQEEPLAEDAAEAQRLELKIMLKCDNMLKICLNKFKIMLNCVKHMLKVC